MTTTAIAHFSSEEVLPRRLEELQACDRVRGTIRRYRSAVEGFLTWYSREEQRSLTFSVLTPIALAGYRNYVPRTQHRATSMVNGQISALRAFCTWLTEEWYLEVNPAKRLKLVGRQDASSCGGLDDTQVNALLHQSHTSRDFLRTYAIIQVLLQTGMRLDECSRLTLDDIELGERSGRVTIRQGKGNEARVVPLNVSARQGVAEYVAPRLNCDPNRERSGTLLAVSFVRWPIGSPMAEPEKGHSYHIGDAADDRYSGSRCCGTRVSPSTNECAYLAPYLCTQLSGRTSWRYRWTGQPSRTYLPRYYEDL